MNFYLNRFKNKWIKEILYYFYILRFTIYFFATLKEGYFEPPRVGIVGKNIAFFEIGTT